MGTKVHNKSYLPEYYSMRDYNEGSSSSNWPLIYGDRNLANGQYYNDFLPQTATNAYPGYDKNVVKQTMLEHEKIFKHQVSELHRLYKIQKDMMDEIKTKELHKHRIQIDTSSSSSPLVSQMPSEDARKWHKNGFSSKDCEILDSRPSKVRKKLFDLQLPADEYIDPEEGEQSLDNKVSEVSSYHPSRNHKIASESSVQLRSPIGLADLNEPVQVEEPALPKNIDSISHSLGRGEIKDLNLGATPKSQFFLGLPRETFQNSKHGSNNGSSSNLHTGNKGNGREWFSCMYEAGNNKTHLNSVPQGLQIDRSPLSSDLMHNMLNRTHQPLGTSLSDHKKGDFWRERTFRGIEPVSTSQVPNAHSSVCSSDFGFPWSQSISGWGKPSSSLTQNLTSIQTNPPLNSFGSLSRTSQSPAHNHEIFGEKWHLQSSCGSNRNGFDPGSSSGSKAVNNHFPSACYDYLNCNKDDKVASERSPSYGRGCYLKGSNVADVMLAKDVNLNMTPAKCPPSEVVLQQGLEIIDEERKYEDHLKVFPWLNHKPACKKEGTSMIRDSISSEVNFLQGGNSSSRNENVKRTNQVSSQKITLASCDLEVGGAKNSEVEDRPVTRKILGFPIFDNPKNESSSLVSTSASLRCTSQGEDIIKTGGKVEVIDINLACEPEPGDLIDAELLVVAKERDRSVSKLKTQIDLNSCVSEEEITVAPSVASTSIDVKIALDIDLEAPPFPESEEDVPSAEEQKQYEMLLKSPEHIAEQPEDEVARIAAEAIVAISSIDHLNQVERFSCLSTEGPPQDPLLWFVDIISSYADEFESKNGGENEASSSEEIDDFEAITMNLKELTEEEYMPKPLLHDDLKVEETGAISLPNRTRRGQGRRGRQRRDFQRDILPGLASLSRHEVTEDLQTFGGMMRATGYHWQPGSNRRNGTRSGGARGRRRPVVEAAPAVATTTTVCTSLVQQLNNIEVGLEDRCLTGWGKTPRRPRRQRCPPAGNPPLIPLS